MDQDRAKAAITAMAEIVVALEGQKIPFSDRKIVRENRYWAHLFLHNREQARIITPSSPNDPARFARTVDADSGLSLALETTDRRGAYYIEKLAWKHRDLLPEHLRPEKPPTRPQ